MTAETRHLVQLALELAFELADLLAIAIMSVLAELAGIAA